MHLIGWLIMIKNRARENW